MNCKNRKSGHLNQDRWPLWVYNTGVELLAKRQYTGTGQRRSAHETRVSCN